MRVDRANTQQSSSYVVYGDYCRVLLYIGPTAGSCQGWMETSVRPTKLTFLSTKLTFLSIKLTFLSINQGDMHTQGCGSAPTDTDCQARPTPSELAVYP